MPGRCGTRPASSVTTREPYLSTVLGALAGPAAKPYQGEVVDPLLPRERRAEWLVTDARALSSALETELARIGREALASDAAAGDRGDARRVPSRASRRARHRLRVVPPRRGRARARSEQAAVVRAAERVLRGEVAGAGDRGARRSSARRASIAPARAVIRCSSRATSRRGKAARATATPGGSHINSGEARDMMLGACASKLSCVECHDPHAPDATAKLRALARRATRCAVHAMPRHATRRRRRSARTRTTSRRARARAASSCHMPKKNMALDGTLVALPPHRLAERPAARAARSAARVRAVPRRQERGVARADDGDVVEAAVRSRGAAEAVRQRSTRTSSWRRRSAASRTSRRSRSTCSARRARRRRSRSSRRSSRIRIRWCAATRSARSTASWARPSRSTSTPRTPRSTSQRRRGWRVHANLVEHG